MDIEFLIHQGMAWTVNEKPMLVKLGGVFNALFAVFHLMFWRLFKWRDDLRTLSFVNRGIMQVLNLCLAFVFVMFAYVSLAHTEDLLFSGLGHSLLVLIALFWLARAVEQIVFFRLRRGASRLLFGLFLVGTLLYALPAAVILADI